MNVPKRKEAIDALLMRAARECEVDASSCRKAIDALDSGQVDEAWMRLYVLELSLEAMNAALLSEAQRRRRRA